MGSTISDTCLVWIQVLYVDIGPHYSLSQHFFSRPADCEQTFSIQWFVLSAVIRKKEHTTRMHYVYFILYKD